MKRGQGLPGDRAEIVFNDVFVEFLEELSEDGRESVLLAVVGLCDNPIGNHPLSNRTTHDSLAGWNTLSVLQNEYRVIFSSSVVDGVGVIEILCAGPRRANAAYDMANALIRTGRLTDDEITEIWQALMLLEVIAESVGLEAALDRARHGVDPIDVTRIVDQRMTERCGEILPRAGVRCIRRAGHPGPHRSRP